MRLDHAARLERLLNRHSDIQHVAGASGNGTLIRRDQLLVLGREADDVHDQVRRWVDRREDGGDVTVLHLRPAAKIDVCEMTSSLSGHSPHRRINAGPNHIMTAAPGWEPGPFDDPTPVAVIPAPPTERKVQRETNVAILDTGISQHQWFVGRKWFASCGSDVQETPDADADERLDSVAGHGTFIAGVVLQEAPDASLLISRVVSGDGVTDELTLARGLAKLMSHAHSGNKLIDVISLSVGCYTHDDKPSPVLSHVINSIDRDTVFVACAGNSNSDRPFWPAALKRVIAVAALDSRGHDRAPFSNYGWWVDACTVGEQIISSFFSFDGLGPDGVEKFDGYALWSGTSFAAPRVAGAIAARAGELGISALHASADLLDFTTRRSMPDLGVLVEVPLPGRSP